MDNYLKKIPIWRFINPYIKRQPPSEHFNHLYLDALSDSLPKSEYTYLVSEENYGNKIINMIGSNNIWKFFEFTFILSACSILFLKRH